MAESNANIGVVIGGDISPLQQSLKKGRKEISNFVGDIRQATNDIVKIGAASGVAAAGGMAALFKVTAQNARELKNFAAISNTTTKEFQKLAFGADQFGISNEKLADILKDVNDRVGDFAATGGGPMADFFEKIAPQLGLTIDSFKRLSGPEALQAYYNALEQANLNQQDMTFFLEAMASDLTLLMPLLKNNSALLKEMGQEAEDLGAILSDTDIAQIEAANKALARAEQVFKGVGQAISVELAPFVEAITNEFVEASKEAGGFGNIVSESIGKASKVVGVMADGVHGAQVVFKGLHLAAAGVGTGIIAVFNEVTKHIRGFINAHIDAINTVTQAANNIPGIDIERLGYVEFGQGVQELTDSSVENLNRLANELRELAMQPLPSENIQSFLDDIKASSLEAAQAVQAVSAPQEITQDAGQTEDPRIAALKERYLTEEELARQHGETMSLIGEEFNSSQFESEEQWRNVRSQAIQDYYNKLQQVREADSRSAINLASTTANSLMSLAQGQSKRAFEITKKSLYCCRYYQRYTSRY